jgi:hypothetical protein
MIVVKVGIAGDRPCGWAYQPRRDDDEPGKVCCGSVQATQNQTLLYVANLILEKLSATKPEYCGVPDADGANVIIQASQLYLINGMNGRDSGKANRDLWDILLATCSKRSLEGFVIRWQHPATENPMREPASAAAKECTPMSLTTPPKARLPF